MPDAKLNPLARSQAGRRAHERAVESLRLGYEERAAQAILGALRAQYEEAAAILVLYGSATVAEQAIPMLSAPMEEAYAEMYEDAFMGFAESVYDAGVRMADAARQGKAYQGKANQDTQRSAKASESRILSWLEYVRAFLSGRVQQRSQLLARETVRRLQSVIAQGIEDGDGIELIARRIRGSIPGMTRRRAVTIVRTEVVAASNHASEVATAAIAEDLGLTVTKVWLTALDERVRSSHRRAHGQAVPQSAPFTVAGEQMMYPGDDSLGATARNLINCRCTVVYEVE